MDLLGRPGAVTEPGWAEEGGRWWLSELIALAATIGGGTSEIQRNVVATRVLWLPRSGRKAKDFTLTEEQPMVRDTARAVGGRQPGLRSAGDGVGRGHVGAVG